MTDQRRPRTFRLSYLLSPLLLLALLACGETPPTATNVDAPLVAKEFVELVSRKDYANAIGKLATVERMGLPPERLRSVWENALAQYGEYQNQSLEGTRPSDRGETVTMKCAFERGTLQFNLTVNNSGQIAGVSFTDSSN
ncbi:MAG TPA: DUF3887 domain-containing protein [Pyrinomonadaceae bacterium]|nr:DUF3887 domain-containing protein [Pyrinomonadaceae bacterium]